MFEIEPSDSVEFQLLHPTATAPQRTRGSDAGLDLRTIETFVLEPGERHRARTGVAVVLAPGTAGLLLPRSGLAAEHGITLLNSPGLIEPSFRDEVCAVMHNAGDVPYEVLAGDRIAQLLIVRQEPVDFVEVEELDDPHNDRGVDGFGSSGRS